MSFKKDVVDMLIGYICETGVDPFLCIIEDHPDLQAPPGFSNAGVAKEPVNSLKKFFDILNFLHVWWL